MATAAVQSASRKGRWRVWFASVYVGQSWEPNAFDVTADGQRFLMVELIKDASNGTKQAKPDVVLVENWFEEFRKK